MRTQAQVVIIGGGVVGALRSITLQNAAGRIAFCWKEMN